MDAAINNRPDAVRTFVMANADTEVRDTGNTQLTALMYAAIYGHAAVARALVLEGKADVEARDTLGRTPLMFAAKNNRLEVAEFLIEQKADLTAVDQDGLVCFFFFNNFVLIFFLIFFFFFFFFLRSCLCFFDRIRL